MVSCDGPVGEPVRNELLRGKRVVLCEDEGLIAVCFEKALIRSGLVVVGNVDSGEAGVEVVLREKPDIVLMDMQLRGMDGLEATYRIMQAHPTCIVIMSAYSDTFTWEQTRVAGATDYLQKPVFSEMLVETLARAWHRFQRDNP